MKAFFGGTEPMSRGAAAAMVAVAAILVYLNTLSNGFVWDDSNQILNNPWIRDVKNLPAIFTSDAWAFLGRGVSNNYRPMMHVGHMTAYHIFGLKAWGQHLFNVALNAGVSVFALLAAREVLQAGKDGGGADRAPLALLAALFFAVNPLHTEIVAWVSAMAELEAALFGLLSFWLYARSREGYGVKFGLSAFFFLLAVLSKESTAPFLIIMAAYDYCLRGGFRWRRYAPFAAAFALYLGLRVYALGGLAPLSKYADITLYEIVINAFPLFAAYFIKLLWPFDLNAFYVLHPVFSATEWKCAASIVFTAAYAAAVFLSNGAWRFALIWMAAFILPVLYIPGLGDNAFAERYLYMPSLGFAFFVLIAAGAAVRKNLFGRRTAAVVAAGLLAVLFVYAAAAINRNAAWRDNLTLWSDTVEKSPDGAVPHNNLGIEYYKTGRIDMAIAEFEAAARLNPYYTDAYYNLGLSYSMLGQGDKAAAAFERSRQLRQMAKQARGEGR